MPKQVDKNLLLDTANVFMSIEQQYLDAGHRWQDSNFLDLLAQSMDELTRQFGMRTEGVGYEEILDLIDTLETEDGDEDA